MDANGCRLPVEPGRNGVVRGKPVTLTVDGRTVKAFEGETIASALYAEGVKVLSRSIKYHRPRGLWCGVGKCANCFMRVDDMPNVRTCVTPVREGLVVESQNALPSARRDLLAVIDKVYRKDFDYHEKFIRPKFLKPVYHKVIRRMAGFGEIPKRTERVPAKTPPIRHLEVDVAVVGAGGAGLAAALSAANAGATVALFEELDGFGGELAFDPRALPQPAADVAGETGAQAAARLADEVGRHARVAQYPQHSAAAIYPGEGLVVVSEHGLLQVAYKSLVVAAGSYDTLPVFEGNDLPGILSPRAALRLLRRHGMRPGERVVIAGATDRAALIADALREAGATVEAVVDDGFRVAPPAGIPRIEGATLRRAKGGTEIASVIVDLPDGGEREIECDCLILAHPPVPRPELFQQAGCALRDDPTTGAFLPVLTESGETTIPGVFAAGGAAVPKPPLLSLLEGRVVGAAAAKRAGHAGADKALALALDALRAARKEVGA